ncbi:WD40-repeat-containing domain protein [Mycena capillaripes]|nr:WD40-repeat-containing domain protein [Mycena capillaripes]
MLRNPQDSDVSPLEDTNVPLRPPAKTPSTSAPIVIDISDDEAETLEVETKLASRSTKTRSRSADSDIKLVENVSPVPVVIDLVSDDDEKVDLKDIRPSSSKTSLDTKRLMPIASTFFPKRKSSPTATDVKLLVHASGSSRREKIIFKGPKSTIKQETRVSKPQTEKRSVSQIESEDSEDEYEHTTTLRAYKRSPSPHSERLEPPVEQVQESNEPWLPNKRRYVNISSAPLPSMPIASSSSTDLWDVLRELKFRPDSRPRPRFLSRKRPRLGEAVDMDHYVKTHHFRRAGGSINSILQHNGRVVVCSNTAGGNVEGETDPYNKPGTLISWFSRDPSKILDLERREASSVQLPAWVEFPPPIRVNGRWKVTGGPQPAGEQGQENRTHYSVHSIAFDPISNTLASAGADKHVRTWKFDANNNGEPYSKSHSYQYKVKNRIVSPHELAFKPGGSLLAIGEQRLTIKDFSVENGGEVTFNLVDKRDQDEHTTGAIAWGFGATSSLIFASSEPVDKINPNGQHRAFDTEALRPLFKFDATEAGDALCVDSTGDIAALVTNNNIDSLLRIYDIRRKAGTAMQTQRLEPFTSEDYEVNSMAFSSDGIYLALGRDDNCTHVYDSRMLKRGVLMNFQHSNMRFSSNDQNFFGVVGVKWVESRSSRLGLVTGGNDGCIRLWNPLHANDEGTVLAQADSDIAYFTLGDRFQGEHELVMGDSSGAVYIMDGHASM